MVTVMAMVTPTLMVTATPTPTVIPTLMLDQRSVKAMQTASPNSVAIPLRAYLWRKLPIVKASAALALASRTPWIAVKVSVAASRDSVRPTTIPKTLDLVGSASHPVAFYNDNPTRPTQKV
jgi:hypothetical protein